MAMQRADVTQLCNAATPLSRGAAQLATAAISLHSLLNSNTNWRGQDAQRFRSERDDASARALPACFAEVKDSMRRFEGVTTVVTE